MRRRVAWVSLGILLLGVLCAPLTHAHSEVSGESFIHAHLPLPEDDVHVEEGVHVEADHSHSDARDVDLLRTTATPQFHFEAVVSMDRMDVIPGPDCCGFASLDAPRAHAPPGIPSRIPRAPPA